MLWDVQVYASNGSMITRLGTYWTIVGSPAVGDTNGDGHVEIWIGGSMHQAAGGDSSSGYLWRFEAEESQISDQDPWPMFHREQQHLGYYPQPPRMQIVPSELFVFHSYGNESTETVYLSVQNLGDRPLDWEIAFSQSDVTLTPLSSTTYYTFPSLVTVTISTSGYQTGTHSLGTAVITSTTPATVEGSPALIPITLYVGQVYRTYLPIVLRSASTIP